MITVSDDAACAVAIADEAWEPSCNDGRERLSPEVGHDFSWGPRACVLTKSVKRGRMRFSRPYPPGSAEVMKSGPLAHAGGPFFVWVMA